MIRLDSININHVDYAYKCKRKLCYICNKKVDGYVPRYSKGPMALKPESKQNCEVGKKPINIPLCEICSIIYANRGRSKKIVSVVHNDGIDRRNRRRRRRRRKRKVVE